MVDWQHLMEAPTLLPDIENLHLRLVTRGHAIGTYYFYMLKVFTSIRWLKLEILEGTKVCFTLSAIKYFCCFESGERFSFDAIMIDYWWHFRT